MSTHRYNILVINTQPRASSLENNDNDYPTHACDITINFSALWSYEM